MPFDSAPGSASAPPKKRRRPFARVNAPKKPAADRVSGPLVAYDLETTNIAAGTPRPLFLTAYGADIDLALRVDSVEHLGCLIRDHLLTDDRAGTRYVAWNGNHFDAYFMAAALLSLDGYVIRPFLTRGKTLRGFVVIRAEDIDKKDAVCWYFLDGIAMLGLAGTPLKTFLDTFAPEFKKLAENIDFEKESFDIANHQHVAYARRDSEGLFHGMVRAESILIDQFNQPLAPTMGRACIKIFSSYIPEGVAVHGCSDEQNAIIRNQVMRGGFCFCVRSFVGPVWKYDINQAYASAMRDADLPAGRAYSAKKPHSFADVYCVQVSGANPANKIPFYVKCPDARGVIRAAFCVTEIRDTWITSIEYAQLKAEGWKLSISDSIYWDETFRMKDYVDMLETTRQQCAGGPKGAVGTMIKAVGNHSYGKTVEDLSSLDLLLAKECPDGYAEFLSSEVDDPFVSFIWSREKETAPREYHQPQIGAFITAHVRMVLRRAALVDPDAWIYADTDCVVFTRDVTNKLDIHAARYGAWKIEESGTPYRIITKKVYSSVETKQDRKTGKTVPKTAHAKGLNVKHLSDEDFAGWQQGNIPEQTQIQRQGFIKVMQGDDMYKTRTRKGSRI